MTRNVTVTIGTVPAVLPAGVSAGGMVVSLLNAADSSVADTSTLPEGAPYVASFTGIADGDYIAQAQAIDSTGADLGTAIQTPFSVSDLLFDSPVAPLGVTVT